MTSEESNNLHQPWSCQHFTRTSHLGDYTAPRDDITPFWRDDYNFGKRTAELKLDCLSLRSLEKVVR